MDFAYFAEIRLLSRWCEPDIAEAVVALKASEEPRVAIVLYSSGGRNTTQEFICETA